MSFIFKIKDKTIKLNYNEINIIRGSLGAINKKETESKVHHNEYTIMSRYFTLRGMFLIIQDTYHFIEQEINVVF